MALPIEDKKTPPAKPSLWDQALKAVKGDSTNDLVEQFTSEMTLVAEGLCEDQARLRKAVDGLIREADGLRDKTAQDYAELVGRLDALESGTARQLKELTRRVDDLSRPKARHVGVKSLFTGDLLGRITVIVAIVCITWLATTALQLFI